MEGVLDSSSLQVECFADLSFYILADGNTSISSSFAMTLWQIWKERNAMVWTGTHKPASTAVHEAATLLGEWSTACKVRFVRPSLPHAVRPSSYWHAPPTDFLKINIDATFFPNLSNMGIGMVHKDEGGNHVMGKTVFRAVSVAVYVGEALGFFEVLSWCKELDLEKVEVEGDARLWWMSFLHPTLLTRFSEITWQPTDIFLILILFLMLSLLEGKPI